MSQKAMKKIVLKKFVCGERKTCLLR